MTDDERTKLRLECHEDLAALRAGGELTERAFRLFEKLVQRLDRIETGSFSTAERPTDPERPRKSSGAMPAFRAQNVIDELDKGKT
jgi:hypothetical protein